MLTVVVASVLAAVAVLCWPGRPRADPTALASDGSRRQAAEEDALTWDGSVVVRGPGWPRLAALLGVAS